MRIGFVLFAALQVGCALPAFAQQPKADCKNPTTQMEMTYCEEQRFDEADKVLNAEYQKARKAMKKWDADATADVVGAEDALVKAQRAWVAYRDAQCASYGYQARGGSMEPQLIYGCRAELTLKRTAELKELTDVMGD